MRLAAAAVRVAAQDANQQPVWILETTTSASSEGEANSTDDDDDMLSTTIRATRPGSNHRRRTGTVACSSSSSGVAVEQKYNDTTTANNNNNDLDDDCLYDEHADRNDESYVNRTLRMGGRGVVTMMRHEEKRPIEDSNNKNVSDAVLSCPCCFGIVCMDCQRHERYDDQYRAMFVMNITVRWDEFVVATTSSTTSRKITNNSDHHHHHQVQSDESCFDEDTADTDTDTDNTKYYSVHCANCQTQVAGLDMRDEVYHFFGCLASAASSTPSTHSYTS